MLVTKDSSIIFDSVLCEGDIDTISIGANLYPICVKYTSRIKGMNRAAVELDILGTYVITMADRWQVCLSRILNIF